MSKINFQKDLENLIKTFDGRKPKLLLHACCGPCSSYCLEYLSQYFEITVFYYNPNIYPEKEYLRRLDELKMLYTRFPPAIEGNVKVVEVEYDPEQYFNAIGVKENPELAKEPEKGERCRRCYKFRLERAYEYAKENHFDYFCTTLSISPFKDAIKINEVGRELEHQLETQLENGDRPQWLPSDFKKNGGFVRSLEISSEYNLYRQDYCGCIYSYNSRQEYLARACSGAQQPE
ncbi:MAG: epoxyqueuosine reductase QueH [Treponema sp.]|nr:epoxyqueuosine reductase QueH [Treponema sp.]